MFAWLVVALMLLVVGTLSVPLDKRLPGKLQGRLNRASLPMLLLAIAILSWVEVRQDGLREEREAQSVARFGTQCELTLLAHEVRKRIRLGDHSDMPHPSVERLIETQQVSSDPARTIEILRARFQATAEQDDRDRVELATLLRTLVERDLEPELLARARDVLREVTWADGVLQRHQNSAGSDRAVARVH